MLVVLKWCFYEYFDFFLMSLLPPGLMLNLFFVKIVLNLTFLQSNYQFFAYLTAYFGIFRIYHGISTNILTRIIHTWNRFKICLIVVCFRIEYFIIFTKYFEIFPLWKKIKNKRYRQGRWNQPSLIQPDCSKYIK